MDEAIPEVVKEPAAITSRIVALLSSVVVGHVNVREERSSLHARGFEFKISFEIIVWMMMMMMIEIENSHRLSVDAA